MALTGIPSTKPQKLSGGVSTALGSAVLEWLLILFLFVDAIFSYLITKFSTFCGLQTPCLFCSRLDHVLGKENAGYYWDLICSGHKFEISSLVFCCAHNKLANVNGMCESCLFSFVTVNKSNAETYRLLVGKLGEEFNSGCNQHPLLGGHTFSFPTARCCSCYDEPCVSRGYDRRLKLTTSTGSNAFELDTPLSGVSVNNSRDQKKGRGKPSVSFRVTNLRNSDLDPLSHIGYTELKIASDTESEVHISDDEDQSAPICERGDTKEDVTVQSVQIVPHNIDSGDDLDSEKLIDLANVPMASVLESDVQLDFIDVHSTTSIAATVETGHGLDGLNWQHVESKDIGSAPTELISHDDIPPSSNGTEASLPTELISLDDILPSSNGTQAPIPTESLDDIPPSSNGTEASPEVLKKIECEESSKADINLTPISETASETNPVSSDIGHQVPDTLDLGDAYKLAVSNRGRQLSATLAEQWLGKDSSRVSEDMKLLLSQLSATRGTDSSVNDISPRLSVNSDDTYNSAGMHILQKRISLERNESGLSLDGSIVSDIEGETVVDRLKRQIEHDKKLINALLQEEKATLHMEALQYLRMMDEQSEYDMEALQKANDLLAEKEKEIQDLEAELEFYHQKFPNELMLENLVETNSDMKVRDIGLDLAALTCIESDAKVLGDSVTGTDIEPVKNPLLEFEDERLYLLQCLKKLEKQFSPFLCNSRSLDNSEYSPNEIRDQVNESTELNSKGGSQENCEKEETDLSKQDAYPLSSCNLHVPSSEIPLIRKGKGELHCYGESVSFLGADSPSIGSVVANFDKRLQALEEDSNFLEHTINLLRIREEGLQFIQEIANHLRELRKIDVRRVDQTDA
ncbi:Myosin-binding protein 1 [Quillaja saponaria]|uniref:Myosin-binding protein 1 n=1 Tax=Quillaja saponaria TaxID=32244 RepID=A0AAD7QC29_QUISA|nr:Myosin-binding protein 1 [Quillaja saponaria]